VGRLGVITGLAREADCLDVFPIDDRPLVRCAAARTQRAYELSRDLINNGCQALLSFGMAGGLREDLTPGALLIASSVIGPEGQVFETSKPWLERVLASLGEEATTATIAGSDKVVTTPAAKRNLAEKWNAALVDMESHAVAAAAEEDGIPFLAIRAVADPAGRAIPAWVTGHISENGTPSYGAILAGLAAHPWELSGLLRLKSDSNRALLSLRRVAGRLGPLFGL
jgi:hopanoid-associated phosphorylase